MGVPGFFVVAMYEAEAPDAAQGFPAFKSGSGSDKEENGVILPNCSEVSDVGSRRSTHSDAVGASRL